MSIFERKRYDRKLQSEQVTWMQRRETWAGDSKANRIRIIALALFAINECVNYFYFHSVDWRFHYGSLIIVVEWALCVGIFHWMLKCHIWPRQSPYLMAAIDLLWLTWLLFLANGPQSPLISIYFLIIGLSGMRLNPKLSLFTSGAAAFGYLAVLEFTKRHKLELLVPIPHAVIIVLALLMMGAIMAHVSGRVLDLANAWDQGRKQE